MEPNLLTERPFFLYFVGQKGMKRGFKSRKDSIMTSISLTEVRQSVEKENINVIRESDLVVADSHGDRKGEMRLKNKK